jgi:hypothetical protein
MKWFAATMQVALYALPFLLPTEVAFKLKLFKIELASEYSEVDVLLFKPYFVNPIDARNVNPLLGLQINYCALLIVAKEALM